LKLIAFHSYQLGLRGTEVAVYDYAHYNETILKNSSIIVTPYNSKGHHHLSIEKFKKRFPVYFYNSESELEAILKKEKADLFYSIRPGGHAYPMPNNIKIAIHSVFQKYEPHGDVYAYISEWLSRKMSNLKYPYVPHMINLYQTEEDLRNELGIPQDAIVFGRHGGVDSFDLLFVKRAVYTFAKKNPDKYFVFLNTDNFLDRNEFFRSNALSLLSKIRYPLKSMRNIIFLEGSNDPYFKRKFLNTCDYMLHARRQGESFGLAIGEFSYLGKPVITCSRNYIKDTAHFEMLGAKGIYYKNSSQLITVLNKLSRSCQPCITEYSHFSPEKVMEKFRDVFLS
jgi:hypothetical protein